MIESLIQKGPGLALGFIPVITTKNTNCTIFEIKKMAYRNNSYFIYIYIIVEYAFAKFNSLLATHAPEELNVNNRGWSPTVIN